MCSADQWRNLVMQRGFFYRNGDYEGVVLWMMYDFERKGDRSWAAYYKGEKIGEGVALASHRAMEAVQLCVVQHREAQAQGAQE